MNERKYPSVKPWRGSGRYVVARPVATSYAYVPYQRARARRRTEEEEELHRLNCNTCFELPPSACGSTSEWCKDNSCRQQQQQQQQRQETMAKPNDDDGDDEAGEAEFVKVMSKRLKDCSSGESSEHSALPEEVCGVISTTLLEEVETAASKMSISQNESVPIPEKAEKAEKEKEDKRACNGRSGACRRKEWLQMYYHLNELASASPSLSQRAQARLDLANMSREWNDMTNNSVIGGNHYHQQSTHVIY